jgi:hypothetical protein
MRYSDDIDSSNKKTRLQIVVVLFDKREKVRDRRSNVFVAVFTRATMTSPTQVADDARCIMNTTHNCSMLFVAALVVGFQKIVSLLPSSQTKKINCKK